MGSWPTGACSSPISCGKTAQAATAGPMGDAEGGGRAGAQGPPAPAGAPPAPLGKPARSTGSS
eukprot:12044600-Alexandrium_andersonii.AAC.1